MYTKSTRHDSKQIWFWDLIHESKQVGYGFHLQVHETPTYTKHESTQHHD